jgi:hypothetical protein
MALNDSSARPMPSNGFRAQDGRKARCLRAGEFADRSAARTLLPLI